MNKYKKMFEWYDNLAWEWYDNMVSGYTHDVSYAHLKARNTLKELVERAIDKTVIWESECGDGFGIHTTYKYIVCPTCGYSFTDDEFYRKVNYCPECGQSLDWAEYEERKNI